MFIKHNFPTQPFSDDKIQMYIRSVRINRPLAIKSKSVFTEQILFDIVSLAKTFEFSHIFVSVYLLTFFSFLILSNMVPH